MHRRRVRAPCTGRHRNQVSNRSDIFYAGRVAKRSDEDPVANGEVDWFNPEEGWGAIRAGEVPGGCFVHFSALQMSGFRALTPGQHVRFTYEQPGFLQDGYPYRALAVWPDDPCDSTHRPPRMPSAVTSCCRSTGATRGHDRTVAEPLIHTGGAAPRSWQDGRRGIRPLATWRCHG